jgi:adenosylcobinamide-GDP ribazoletransferase
VNPLLAFRAAVALLTRIPVGSSPIRPRDVSWCPAMFPLVGFGLGAISSFGLSALSGLGGLGAATTVVATQLYLTGAFHEDGLADSADGLGGSAPANRTLEIMKDSRIGTYGTVALVCALVLRIALLSRLAVMGWLPIVLYGGIARLTPLWLMTHLPHAAPSNSAHRELQNIGKSRAYLGTLLAVLFTGTSLWLAPSWLYRAIVGLPMVLLVSLLSARTAHRRLGGITGDILGAAEQLTELALLAVFAWSLA